MEDIKYIAGLFDGEGSAILFKRVRNGRTSFFPSVQIGLIGKKEEKRVLENVQKFFGAGRIYVNKNHKPHPMLHWKTTNLQETEKVCKTLAPFLIIKKRRCMDLLKATRILRKAKGERTNRPLSERCSPKEISTLLKTST